MLCSVQFCPQYLPDFRISCQALSIPQRRCVDIGHRATIDDLINTETGQQWGTFPAHAKNSSDLFYRYLHTLAIQGVRNILNLDYLFHHEASVAFRGVTSCD